MKTVHGQAASYSETLKGQLDITKQLGTEGAESLGSLFAPAIEMVTHGIQNWIQAQGGINKFLEDSQTPLIVVGSLLTGLLLAGFIVTAAAALAFLGPLG